MSTMKRMYELLDLVRHDPARPTDYYASTLGVLPIEVESWLEHMRLDEIVEERPGTWCDIPGWYITEKGLEVISWYEHEDETTETKET